MNIYIFHYSIWIMFIHVWIREDSIPQICLWFDKICWSIKAYFKSFFLENWMQHNAAGWKNETKKQDHLKNKSLKNIFWGQLNLPLFGSQSDLQLSAFERKISARFSCWIYQPPKLIEFCWFKIYLWNQSYNVKIPKPGKVW